MFPIEEFKKLQTPFYYYDTHLLRQTLKEIRKNTDAHMHVHYAVKACANPKILSIIAQEGFGADCVSGGEIKAALQAGFPADKIVYAGVGKSDWEIDMQDMDRIIALANEMKGVNFIGLHFHIGSQILEMDDFKALSTRINEIQDHIEAVGLPTIENINVGGGLGINYHEPDQNPIPDFRAYFETYRKNLSLRPGQQLHFELGRAIVGQCGTLIARVLYIKSNPIKNFCIVDAGMTDLIRPALYNAYHHIENLTADSQNDYVAYDVVGPICESSDVFIKNYGIPRTKRHDLIAFRSAGAYGEIMASGYNCRTLPKGYITEDLV